MTEEEKKKQEAAAAVKEANQQTPATEDMEETPKPGAETKENEPAEQTEQTEEPTEEPTEEIMLAKDKYRKRYKEAHPDMNLDDEETFYGQANKNLDELGDYRKNNKEISDAFEKNPTLAAMLIAAKDGENPFVWLGENLGMDVRELTDDPEFGTKISDALIAYQNKISEGKKAHAQIESDFQKSIEALKEVCNTSGMSEEQANSLYTDFFEKIIDPATRGIVSKETWDLMRKGMNYDADMEATTQKASAKALNQKIENKVQHSAGQEVPPTLGAGGEPKPQNKKKRGFFADTRDL